MKSLELCLLAAACAVGSSFAGVNEVVFWEGDVWADFAPGLKPPSGAATIRNVSLSAPRGASAVGAFLVSNVSSSPAFYNLTVKTKDEPFAKSLEFYRSEFVEKKGARKVPEALVDLPVGSVLEVPPQTTYAVWIVADSAGLGTGTHEADVTAVSAYADFTDVSFAVTFAVGEPAVTGADFKSLMRAADTGKGLSAGVGPLVYGNPRTGECLPSRRFVSDYLRRVAERATEAAENAFTEGRAVIPGGGLASVVLDRPSAAYRTGETAEFSVTVLATNGVKAASGTVSWTLDNYGARKLGEGTSDLAKCNPFVVRGALDRPGFLRLTVLDAGGKVARRYSAAYDAEKIRTAVPKPKDFDAFWDGAIARLEREVPLDPKVIREPDLSTDKADVYSVSFATFGGRVYGALTVPRGPAGRRYPAAVGVPGAGPGYVMSRADKTVGSVSLVMSVHKFPLPKTAAERTRLYEAQEAACCKIHGPSSARAYPVSGMTVSREAVHYFPIILGINRAVDWLARRPDVDATRITYCGFSQGGGFGLYLCGLNRHFARGVMGVPALTDVLGCKADGRQSGWPRILEFETQKDPARLAKIEEIAPYFDAAYFAERIGIPVLLSVGYVDESCAPHAVCAAYNAIPSKRKVLHHGIGGHHGSPNVPEPVFRKFLKGEE